MKKDMLSKNKQYKIKHMQQIKRIIDRSPAKNDRSKVFWSQL